MVRSTSEAARPVRQGVRTQSLERVSVIDGADRMVYSDIRDRKGWRQPLAAHEALSDANRSSGGSGGKGARIVQTIEGEQEQVANPRAGEPAVSSRYALGKASVLTDTGRASQPQSRARQQPSETVRETPTARARR